MPKTQKVSIIVPVHNGGETLAECLTALIEQNYPKSAREIIVVDDGSTDATADIITSFPVRVISLPMRRGRLVARYLGARAARFPQILFVDSRIIAPHDLLSRLIALKSSPIMVADDTYEPGLDFWPAALFILRRWYYRPYFPQAGSLTLTPENFAAAPKGTTTLFIDRALWLRNQPAYAHINSHDDSAILAEIVKQTPIHRRADLGITYRSRIRTVPVLKHIFQRGPVFADYYLKSGGRYRKHLFIALGTLGVLTILGYIYPAFRMALPLLLLTALTIFAVYISDNFREWTIITAGLPVIAAVFAAGVGYGLFTFRQEACCSLTETARSLGI